MQIIIDRIEGDMAVVELPDRRTVVVPLSFFPDAKEGGVYEITKNEDETAEREKRIQSKFDKLKKRQFGD